MTFHRNQSGRVKCCNDAPSVKHNAAKRQRDHSPRGRVQMRLGPNGTLLRPLTPPPTTRKPTKQCSSCHRQFINLLSHLKFCDPTRIPALKPARKNQLAHRAGTWPVEAIEHIPLSCSVVVATSALHPTWQRRPQGESNIYPASTSPLTALFDRPERNVAS